LKVPVAIKNTTVYFYAHAHLDNGFRHPAPEHPWALLLLHQTLINVQKKIPGDAGVFYIY